MALLVPPIVMSRSISVATYDFVDKLIAKTLTRKIDTNVATLTLDRAHFKNPGDLVYVNGISTHAEYNGYFVITAVPSATSFSYALVHADELVTADTGGVVHDPIARKDNGFFVRSGAGDIRYSTIGNVALQTTKRKIDTNVATIWTKTAHGLLVGSTVMVSAMTHTDYNGYRTVTTVPTPFSFTFALSHGDEAEGADVGGLIDECVTKTVAAQVNFVDPEIVRKIFTTGTTATGIVIGYSPAYHR